MVGALPGSLPPEPSREPAAIAAQHLGGLEAFVGEHGPSEFVCRTDRCDLIESARGEGNRPAGESVASDASSAGLIIGLHHFLFNAIGVAVWYSIPTLRNIPIALAERLAVLAEVRKSIVIVYTVGLFIVVPIIGVLVLQ